MQTKICNKCNVEKSVDLFYFRIRKDKKIINSQCKKCIRFKSGYSKEYDKPMDLPNEQWKNIPNYEGYYQASNLGRIKSLERFIKHKTYGISMLKEKILSQGITTNGYNYVGLSKNNIAKTKQVHQLVAMAFLNHIPCRHERVVNHINFIRTDNRLKNLEIISQQENANKKHINSSSIYTGVHFAKKSKKWIARITINKVRIHLGSFTTENDAKKYCEEAFIESKKNNPNIKIKKPNYSSIHKGISYSKKDNNWVAVVYGNKKSTRIGAFKTEQEAFNALNKYKQN